MYLDTTILNELVTVLAGPIEALCKQEPVSDGMQRSVKYIETVAPELIRRLYSFNSVSMVSYHLTSVIKVRGGVDG